MNGTRKGTDYGAGPAPKLSAIVCVRNGERFLERCFRSIERQDVAADDYVLVDGASTDGTLDIVRRFPQWRIVAQTGRGIADAYNCGVGAATGELIAFLSHDDEWTEGSVRMRRDYLLSHPELDFVLGRALSRLKPGHQPPPGFRVDLLEREHAGAMETLMVWRRVFEKVGLFDSRYSTAEDLDWLARAKDLGLKAAVVPHLSVIKYVHDANLSLHDAKEDRNLLRLVHESIRRKERIGKR
jgi:glycosyltransferase involved in cell wall biosynthesis